MDASQSPEPRFKKPLHPWTIRGLIIGGIVVVLAVGTLLGLGGYKKVRHQRVMDRARAHIENKNFAEAALSLQWALQMQPGDPQATRLLAEAAEAAGSREATQLRRSLATLEPKVPANYLTWANSALRHGDLTNARMALEAMRDAGLEKNSGYHDARARLADASGQPEQIAAAMAEAVKLEPENALYRLRLASLEVASPEADVRARALSTIDELSQQPETRRPATRVLLYTALATRDSRKVLETAERLRRAPDATFADRLVYLGIMRKAGRWEFWWDLGQLQANPPADPVEFTEGFRWLVRNDLSGLAAEWGRRLPNERRLRPPLAIAVAEAFTVQRDWENLRPIVKAGDWGDLDFQRRALLARVLREQGDETGSRAQWHSAVSGAGDKTEAYNTLLTLTKLWNWKDEQDALLWVIARGQAAPRPALDELLRRNLAEGRTRELLAVFARLLELEPKSPEAKNNAAYASLLLNTDKKRAETLAAEAYKADPQNPGFAATYAFALHSAGKHDEGLKIARTIPEQELAVPSNALSYGLLLAATGAKDEARKHLAIAQAGRLLPEEKALATRAVEKLGK